MKRMAFIMTKYSYNAFTIRVQNGVSGVEGLWQQACGEVRRSEELKAVLTVALAAGNALNAGTARGDAAGFTLDSLHKLSDVRSTISRGGNGGGGGGGGGRGGDGGGGGGGGVASSSDAPAPPSTLLDFIVAVADERILKMREARRVAAAADEDAKDADVDVEDGDKQQQQQQQQLSLTSELKSCAAGGRWSQNDLASAMARIDMAGFSL